MTHQHTYQIAQQRIADLHRTAHRERLAHETANNQAGPPIGRLTTRLLTVISAALKTVG